MPINAYGHGVSQTDMPSQHLLRRLTAVFDWNGDQCVQEKYKKFASEISSHFCKSMMMPALLFVTPLHSYFTPYTSYFSHPRFQNNKFS